MDLYQVYLNYGTGVTNAPTLETHVINYIGFLEREKYYTIIDFNEVDIRIYLPEKVNITFKGKKILLSTEIEVNNSFVM